MNRILLAILILTGFSGCFNQGSLDNHSLIRRVPFRGWDSTILMTNGTAEVILNPEYGGNVVYYGFVGENNILWADTVVNGWTLRDFIITRRSPDAGRFDIGNERKTEYIHDRIWAGRYQVEILSDSSVRLTSPVSEEIGIQLSRTFILDDNSTRLKIVQTISNISDGPKEYCFWTRTLLPSGGIFFSSCTGNDSEEMPFAEISLATDSIIVSSQDRMTGFAVPTVTSALSQEEKGSTSSASATWMEPRHISRTDCSMSKETEMQILPGNTKTTRDFHSL